MIHRRRWARAPGEAPRVLLCTSNGAGLGHVTRMLAVAEHLPDGIEPVMFTLSAALPIPFDTGICVEHLPSQSHVGAGISEWHGLLEERVDALVASYRPDVVLFDGVHPYRGFVDALRRWQRSVTRVWVRRSMWRPEIGTGALHRTKDFDIVIEPGDFAAEYDHGATTTERSRTIHVPPIVYDGPAPRLERFAACTDLGLDPEATNVLIQLGAGTINDVSSLTGRVVAALAERCDRPHAAVARSVLSKDRDDDPNTDRVSVVRRYPISRYLAAFDLAVIAGGYNSFHECLSHGVPTLVIPNLHTKTDDQDARSRWAADVGVGARWDGGDDAGLRIALDTCLDECTREQMRERLARLPAADGGRHVASMLARWVR